MREEVVKMETSFSYFLSISKICIDPSRYRVRRETKICQNIFFDGIFSVFKDVPLMLREFDKCIVK